MLKDLLMFMTSAIDDNIMVFDRFAQDGEFTKYLISTLKFFVLESKMHSLPITKLYISKHAFTQAWAWSLNSMTDWACLDTKELYVLGIKLIPCEELELNSKNGETRNNHLLYVFKEFGCELPSGDDELIIGVSDDNSTIMLGCF